MFSYKLRLYKVQNFSSFNALNAYRKFSFLKSMNAMICLYFKYYCIVLIFFHSISEIIVCIYLCSALERWHQTMIWKMSIYSCYFHVYMCYLQKLLVWLKMGKNKYHPYITPICRRHKTLKLAVSKKSSRYKFKQDRLYFQLFWSCISNSKGESSMQNESIDMEQVVCAHVIPKKWTWNKGVVTLPLELLLCLPFIIFFQQNVSFLTSQLASPCVILLKINLEQNSDNYIDTSTDMEQKMEANANFPDWNSVFNVTSPN